MENRPVFIPALSCATTSYFQKPLNELLVGNCVQSPRFYNKSEDPYFYHPYSLWSAAHHYKIPDLRKSVRMDADAKVMIDSGGYQLAKGAISEKNWNNETALAWSEANGDIFPILDRPNISAKDYEANKQATIGAARYYAENRSAEDKIILNVMSAPDINSMEDSYKAVSPFKFEGWAHGGHQNNIKSILKGFLLLLQKGEYDRDFTWHHVFGISSIEAMLYLAHIQKKFNELGINIQISYDSSSFQRSMAFGIWFMTVDFQGFTALRLSNRFNFDNLSENAKLPCLCNICSNVTDVKHYIDNVQDFYILGSMHNLQLMLNIKTQIENLVYMGSDEVVESALNAHQKKNFQAIDKAFANHHKGIELVDMYFSGKNKTVEPEASLMDFYEE